MSKKFYEVFRAGTYTVQDSANPSGKKEVTFSEEDVQAIVDLYDRNFLDAPITIDHVKIGPAFGWVEELKKEGPVLLASFGDVVDSFAEAVQKKQYKRVSAEILPSVTTEKGKGPYLRAVSFLGASSPAVKGLKEVQFSENEESVYVDFDEVSEPVTATSNNDVTINFSTPSGEKVLVVSPSQKPVIDALLLEFADMEAARKTAEGNLNKLRLSYRKNEYQTFLNERIAYGNLTPAQLPDILKILETLDAVNQFSDVEGSEFDRFKKTLIAMPKFVQVNTEFATNHGADNVELTSADNIENFSNADPSRLALHKEVLAYAKKHSITYGEALSKISKK